MPASHADAAVLMIASGLRNLAHLLACAEADAGRRGLDPRALAQARLAPDMLPLSAQVAMACNGAVQRLGIVAAVPRPLVEAEAPALPDLREMCLRSAHFVDGLAGQAWAERDDARQLQIDFPPGFPAKTVQAGSFLRQAVVPNFYFHLCMAYALLRQQGVAIGKLDYLYGDQPPHPPPAVTSSPPCLTPSRQARQPPPLPTRP